ncbi:unnamed protein product, partial [Mesorhabditis belari]|uniref:Uncharacterized protein n=1 Tax=Mesorhabditis belari TaxID=2138241 RepID=A0AAF3EKP1_9BILA
MTYGSLTVQFLGLLTAIFMPSREIPNSIFCKIPRTSQSQQIKNMFSSITKSSLLLLAPLHLFRGMYIAFWLTIYPTTIAFTGQFAKNHNLIGYICIAFTIGEIALGFFISHFSKKVKDFGLWPVFSMVIGSFSLNVLVWVLFTPKLSSIQPTNDPAIFENCIPIVIAMGALNGIVDGCLNNVIMVILPKVLPSNPAVSFSISKFYQSIASATFYFVSSLLTVHQLGALLTFTLATAAVGFSIVVKRVKAAHQIAPEGKK